MSTAQVVRCAPAPLSALDWLGLTLLALWPHGIYLVQRALDGSDDPLGLMALASLALLVGLKARALRWDPQLHWLAASLALVALANAAWVAGAPALMAALLAALGLACAITAWWPQGQPLLPAWGLVLLSLPLIASLQFYAGWPLRVLTAQLSAWGLQVIGYDALRQGASMVVQGRLVIVDAPCSGVQMAWLAYFCACCAASLSGLADRQFIARLPWVGLAVISGNVLRNSVLVALESRPQGLDDAAHQAIGLVALVPVCVLAMLLMWRRGVRHEA